MASNETQQYFGSFCLPPVPRDGRLLAAYYGFSEDPGSYEGLEALARELPEGARAIDVGSGRSTLGIEVASLRPDVTWTNFDPGYADAKVVDRLSSTAPKNVRYIAGDITAPLADELCGSFDRVYTFYMLPHLSLESYFPAYLAVGAMMRMLAPGGVLRYGPIGANFTSYFEVSGAYFASPDIPPESDLLDATVQEIVRSTAVQGKAARARHLNHNLAHVRATQTRQRSVGWLRELLREFAWYNTANDFVGSGNKDL